MNARYATVLALTGLVVAACGPTSPTKSPRPTTSSSPRVGPTGVRGSVAQIAGTSFKVTLAQGIRDFSTDASTVYTQIKYGAISDIQVGDCLGAIATKDASGALTASLVADGPNECAPPAANPSAALAKTHVFAYGKVTAVSATSVTITGTAASTLVGFAATTRVELLVQTALSGLAIGNCVLVAFNNGEALATRVTVIPTGPNGCFAPTPAPSPSASATG